MQVVLSITETPVITFGNKSHEDTFKETMKKFVLRIIKSFLAVATLVRNMEEKNMVTLFSKI